MPASPATRIVVGRPETARRRASRSRSSSVDRPIMSGQDTRRGTSHYASPSHPDREIFRCATRAARHTVLGVRAEPRRTYMNALVTTEWMAQHLDEESWERSAHDTEWGSLVGVPIKR